MFILVQARFVFVPLSLWALAFTYICVKFYIAPVTTKQQKFSTRGFIRADFLPLSVRLVVNNDP